MFREGIPKRPFSSPDLVLKLFFRQNASAIIFTPPEVPVAISTHHTTRPCSAPKDLSSSPIPLTVAHHPIRRTMAIEMSQLENALSSSKISRLRLMTLLSLYDMLPHSISRPPTGQEPMDLDDAIDQETVNRVLALVRANNAASSNTSHPHVDGTSGQVSSSADYVLTRVLKS